MYRTHKIKTNLCARVNSSLDDAFVDSFWPKYTKITTHNLCFPRDSEGSLRKIWSSRFWQVGYVWHPNLVTELKIFLQNVKISAEQFHDELINTSNDFQIRPFVIPFIKANLPYLQRELLFLSQQADGCTLRCEPTFIAGQRQRSEEQFHRDQLCTMGSGVWRRYPASTSYGYGRWSDVKW